MYHQGCVKSTLLNAKEGREKKREKEKKKEEKKEKKKKFFFDLGSAR